MKLYVGLKEIAQPAIFESEKEPNKETHPQYDIIHDQFKSKEDAETCFTAMGRGVVCREG
jgi:hypothetical protein